MPKFIRTFIALPVLQQVKEELRRLQNELRDKVPTDAVRWARPEQFHLTLKFLGDIQAERVNELAESVSRACAGMGPIALQAEGVGLFPAKGPVRVIWVAACDDGDVLKKLQRAVALAAEDFVDAKEEPDYTGHLTIGRARNLKSTHSRGLRELAGGFSRKTFGHWNADAVEIMRSELGATVSRHSCIATIPLIGSG